MGRNRKFLIRPGGWRE